MVLPHEQVTSSTAYSGWFSVIRMRELLGADCGLPRPGAATGSILNRSGPSRATSFAFKTCRMIFTFLAFYPCGGSFREHALRQAQ